MKSNVLPLKALTKEQAFVISQRPLPPPMGLNDFRTAEDIGDWAASTFIKPHAPLCNPRHNHLNDAKIGWLWTTAEGINRDRLVAGECTRVLAPRRTFGSAMRHWQLDQWFGEQPDFVITISAWLASEMDDPTFCALIEHELCHAAQDTDINGDPRFDREGHPVFRIIGHDVEEFVDVVARYGAAATGVETMVAAANAGPLIASAQISQVCGTCNIGKRAA
jgi:Putative phage metallopeptidase